MHYSLSKMAILSLLFLFIAGVFIFNALGYRTIYSMYDSELRGEELAQEGGNPHYCWKIKTFFPTYPPLAHFQSGCIQRYAKISQDPSACELLLPSESAITCINNVISEEYREYMDSGFFDYSECDNKFEDTLKEDWCNILKAHLSKKTEDCDGIINPVIREGCILKFEAWDKYPEIRESSSFGQN